MIVVGLGNSPTDIAVNASYSAALTTLSVRREAHVLTKHLFGVPFDQFGLIKGLPDAARWAMFSDGRRPTWSSTAPGTPWPCHSWRPRCWIPVRTIAFGSTSACSPPEVPGLSVVGLVQPLGAVMPLAEEQGRLVADQLTGVYALPDAETMRAEMDGYEAWLGKRFVLSTRHTLEVDFDDYLRQLKRERRRGGKRAETLRGGGADQGVSTEKSKTQKALLVVRKLLP